MQLTSACNTILDQLSDLVKQLKGNDFSMPSKALGQSTIGQHLRHTLEFFICLKQGYANGVVNYDKRTHDKLIETDSSIAVETIETIKAFVNSLHVDQSLLLEVGYNPSNEETTIVNTNYLRELTYNIEHAVHHMAIMKIGIREVASYVTLPADFGVAVSTLRYKQDEILLNSN